jgi:gliding motility-associated-like protein
MTRLTIHPVAGCYDVSAWFVKKLVSCFLLLLVFVVSYSQPVADFTPSKSSGCSPLLVKFTNNTTGGATSYTWNFGNGNTSTFANPAASFINPGTYVVTLTAKGPSGSHTATKNIVVSANPVADFAADKPGGCVNDSVCFTDLSVKGTGNITQWSWDFGDGNSSARQQPFCNRYDFADSFKVTLVVTDVNGCQSTLTKPKYVKITDHTVQFKQDKTVSCNAPLTVAFRDTTSPARADYTYLWTFGNGSTSSAKVASSVYALSGKYDVTLKVTSANGCSKVLTKKNAVVIHSPKADFATSVVAGCQPLSTGLRNTSVSADTTVLSYVWKTSSGHSSAEKNPVFVFTTPGIYTVSLKTIVPGVCADSVVKTNLITVHAKTPIDFTLSKSRFCAIPAAVTFTSLPPTLSVVKWVWSDGSTSLQANPVKVFNSFGSYGVTLISQNVNGCFDTVVKTNQVRISRSGFKIALSATKGCRPLAVTMQAVDTGLVALTTWQWSVNGVPFSVLPNAAYTFTDTGIYVIRCSGMNAEGCSQILYDTVKAGMETRPKFTVDKPSDCFSNGPFVFTNHTNDTTPRAESFSWKLGGGAVSTAENPTQRYTDTGTFKVTLIAIYKGCSTEVTNDAIIVKGPKALFNAPVVNCFNDSMVLNNGSKGGNKWLWDMGDGRMIASKNIKYRYAAPGTYEIMMTAWDTTTGCVDSMTNSVMIPKAPVVGFGQTDSVGCPGIPIQFADKSTYDAGSIKGWKWTFSDGQTATGPASRLNFSMRGYHSAQLTLTDIRNCLFSFKKDSAIHVYGGNALFTLTPETGCMPMDVAVSDQSVSDFAIVSRTWKWGTGDSLIQDAGNASYRYTKLPADQNAGFTIGLTITDHKGCKYSTTKKVKPGRPVPQFTATIIKRCGYDSVRFAAAKSASTGIGPFTFKWQLGDGAVSDSSNPVKKYTSGERSYVIGMKVADSNGCVDSVSKMINVNASVPVAGFIATPEGILDCPGPPIFFADTTTKGASGIKTWLWDFGDSTRSVLRNPAKTYLVPGIYTLRLTITDSLGCVSKVVKNNSIKIAGPVASYLMKPLSGCSPLSVSFKATSSNTRKFEWDLADGMIDSNAMHIHIYERAGIYIPNLTITDSSGCKRALPYADTIRVFALPKPDFETDKTTICKGSSISFNNTSTHDREMTEYRWNVGGKLIVRNNQQPFSQMFDRTGVFNVSLRAADELGCADTMTKTGVVIVTDDTVPPVVPTLYRATVTGNESVLMEFSQNHDPDFDKYVVYYNYSAQGQPAASVTRQLYDTTFVHTSVNTLQQVYSYSVSAKDVCLNESKPSAVHSTIELKAKPEVNAIRLNWTAYKGWKELDNYEIYRLNAGTGQYEHLHTVNGTLTTYLDTTVLCFRTVFYKIRGVEPGGFMQESWSDTSGAQPVFENTMPSTQNIRATVLDNKRVLVQWRKRQHKESFTALIYRAVDDGEPVSYKEISSEDTLLIDVDVDVNVHTYAYTTYLKDNCGGMSAASNVAKTILLKVDLKENDRAQYNPELSWSRYGVWNPGVERYDVEFKYDSLGEFSSIASTVPDKVRYFDQYLSNTQTQYCYRITAYQKGDNKVFSESNVACVSTEPKLYAPTAFTINGDNLNETFKLGGIFLEDFHIQIVNRYGEIVFKSDNMDESWDGTFMGNPVPADVYMFHAEGHGRNGKLVTIKGTVTLIR